MMTPKKLDNLIENQKNNTSSVDVDKCKEEKARLESENAKFVLKKEIIPFTRWYLKNLKDDSEINIEVGDQLELIDLEQSFTLDNRYKGTTRNTVLELGPGSLKLKTPEPYALLINEGTFVFAINKPLYKNEFNATEELMSYIREETRMKNENTKRLTSTIGWTVVALIALIVIVIIVLV